ncbi:retrovirus-related pol polyprotein from transposon TNT 1-94 [Tanacetum coccineum]
MATTNSTAEGNEGALHLGPERPRVYSDLSPEDKERYNADIRATNISLQGLLKDIYSLINHYTDAKDIWDNVKMLLEGLELTKEDRESQLMQLNSKFVNNMLPEWGRFVTAVKLNRGLRDSNYDQLYVYLKQHKAHANENKMMLERFTQPNVDPPALMSNVSHQQYNSQSSTNLPSTYVPPHFADNTQLDLGLSSSDNLIKNLTNTLDLLNQSYKTVVVQNVQGRQNRGQGNNAQGTGAAGYGGAQNRVGNANPGQARQVKCYNCNGRQDNAINEDVDEQLVQDLALNVDNVFQADDCDAFDSDVDEAPMAQTMFMANLSSADPVYDEAGLSYDSDILSEMKEEALKKQTTTSRPIKALTEYPPNTPAMLVHRVLPIKSQVKINIFALIQLFLEFEKTCKKRITPMGLTEGERGFEQTKKCYLTEFIPFLKTLKEHFKGIQKALTKEIKEMKDIFEELEAEVDQNIVNRKHDEITQKNLLIANDNLIVDCLSKEVFYIATNSELIVYRFTEMHEAYTIVQTRCLELEAELSKLRDKVQKDNHTELVKRFSNLEITQLTEKISILQEQNELFRVENEKVKQHYKELYDSIKITRAKHIEQTMALLTENENPKCNTMEFVKPRVLTPGRYAIDVEPVPLHNRNNREIHLHYLKHLKRSVKTLREIVEEAKVERPFDRSLASTCLYTKHSQELLEYAIGTCPKAFNQRDKNHAPTPVIRKKQVTFKEQCYTSNSNTHKHVEQLNTQKTNVPVHPSTGVNCCTNASGSQPRSNTKKIGARQLKVVQIIIWYLDSGCSKHMTGDYSWLRNFVKKFIGTVRFGNDHFGAIMGCGDYVIGDSVISKVYYVEGLGHNLFSVRHFCDSDLEVTFRKHSCYVRDTDGVELIKGSRGSNLYTISVEDMMKSSPICLLSKASKNKSWLWHRRLNHLNFGTINDLARKDLVRGLPRLKFEKDHLCSACQLGKSKKHTHKPKTENTNLEVLNTLHMDLCGPMRVQTINGKKYILVIVDDYSRFTWVKFLRSKDETPEVVIKFLKQIQVGLNKTIRYIRTDNGTEFVNKDLTAYYERVGIFHQKTVPRTPQQNGIVERRNRTLVEAARTMLIFSKAPA